MSNPVDISSIHNDSSVVQQSVENFIEDLPELAVWGSSTLRQLDAALEGAHELSGPPHERINELIRQRDEASTAFQQVTKGDEWALRGAALKLVDEVISQLEDGFVACENCGNEEETKNLDCMYELRQLRALMTTDPITDAEKMAAAPIAQQAGAALTDEQIIDIFSRSTSFHAVLRERDILGFARALLAK